MIYQSVEPSKLQILPKVLASKTIEIKHISYKNNNEQSVLTVDYDGELDWNIITPATTNHQKVNNEIHSVKCVLERSNCYLRRRHRRIPIMNADSKLQFKL